jgi:2-isopropylmalate synthase
LFSVRTAFGKSKEASSILGPVRNPAAGPRAASDASGRERRERTPAPLGREDQRMDTQPSLDELIFDWNRRGGDPQGPPRPFQLNDETLRDGIQCPSVKDPATEQKVELLHLMVKLGIHSLDIGLPGAGPKARQDTTRLATEIRDAKLPIEPNCAARTVIADIAPVAQVSQQVGIPIEAAVFIGSSPIRLYAEGWTVDELLRRSSEAIDFAVKEGLPCMYVTEDTTRANPEVVARLYRNAVEHGARRVCIADTVGHATPRGTAELVRFVREVVDATGEAVKIDWHGHQDRGLGVINTLAAIEAGADRVHACALGVGERVGNTPMDTLLVNLKLLGWLDADLTCLREYVETTSRICRRPVPVNYPVFGADAFRTATGVHAAAIIKAQGKGDAWLADRVYSGVPAGMFGLRQVIEIGNMSGVSNVQYWLRQRGVEPEAEQVERILQAAKASDHVLGEDEVWALVGRATEPKKAGES